MPESDLSMQFCLSIQLDSAVSDDVKSGVWGTGQVERHSVLLSPYLIVDAPPTL